MQSKGKTSKSSTSKKPSLHGKPWSKESIEQVKGMFLFGQKPIEIAKHFNRTTGSIRAILDRAGFTNVVRYDDVIEKSRDEVLEYINRAMDVLTYKRIDDLAYHYLDRCYKGIFEAFDIQKCDGHHKIYKIEEL